MGGGIGIRQILWLNAVVQLVGGGALVAASETISEWFDIEAETVQSVGALVFVSSVIVVALALWPGRLSGLVRGLAILNLVIGAAAWFGLLLLPEDVTTAGQWFLGAVGDITLALGVIQLLLPGHDQPKPVSIRPQEKRKPREAQRSQ